MNAPLRTAVIGLGSMGQGIAASLLRAGHATLGVDVDAERVQRFVDEGGSAMSLLEAASSLRCVVLVVLNAAQGEAVLFGGIGGGAEDGADQADNDDGIGVGDDAGLVSRLEAGAVVIACATVAPAVARDLARRCAAHGVHYLDAPISGGSLKAAGGELSIMASGSAEAFAAARPVLDAIASTVFELGDESGAGSAMKAVNQMLAGVHIAAMAEALTFGMTQGVTPERFVEVISRCAGTSWMLENRAPHIVAGDYAPRSSVDIWPKDLGIVLDIARGAGFSAPVTAAALQQFLAASGSGLGAEDDAAIAKVYARNAGLTLPERH